MQPALLQPSTGTGTGARAASKSITVETLDGVGHIYDLSKRTARSRMMDMSDGNLKKKPTVGVDNQA